MDKNLMLILIYICPLYWRPGTWFLTGWPPGIYKETSLLFRAEGLRIPESTGWREHLEVTGICQRKVMALPTSAWQEHTHQGHMMLSVPTLGTTGKHLLSCPMWTLGNVWSLSFTSPSNKLNRFVSPWNQFLLMTHGGGKHGFWIFTPSK